MLLHALRRGSGKEAMDELKRQCFITHGEPLAYLAAAGLSPLLTWSLTHPLPLIRSASLLEKVMHSIDYGMRAVAGGDALARDHYSILFASYSRAIGGVDDPLRLRRLTGMRMAVHETVPFIALASMRNIRDFEYAMIETVNAGGDTPSTAMLVGAIVGANVGLNAIPANLLRAVPEARQAVEIADKLVDLATERLEYPAEQEPDEDCPGAPFPDTEAVGFING
jgi:ADP-ribosylglycohydrolase